MKRFLLTLAAALLCVPLFAAEPTRKHLTGARVNHAKWAAAPKFDHNRRMLAVTPPESLGFVPQKLTMWGNDQYGDCVPAETPSAIYGHRLWLNAQGANIPEISISDSTLIAWARAHGDLNGAMLDQVMDDMKTDGLADVNKILHTNGTYTAVDYTSQDAIRTAYANFGPLKIAVASSQLDVVQGSNGWILTGARRDNGCDHCTGIHGYGRMDYLAKLLGVSLPSGVDPASFGVLMYTWSTIGIVDWQSLQGLMAAGECWARNPVDIPNGVPYPTPTPGPGPSPNWPSLTGVLFDRGGIIDGSLILTLPANQAAGTWKYLIQRNADGQYSPAPQVFGADVLVPIEPPPAVDAPTLKELPLPKAATKPQARSSFQQNRDAMNYAVSVKP